MSVQLMGAAIACGPRDQNTFCVLNALANYADDFGFCCPSIETITADSRCAERTIYRALDQLVDEGWIYRAKKVLNGKSNIYILNLAKLGVTVSPMAKRSPLFTRLLRSSGDRLAPIFAPEKSTATNTFSGDNPQPPQLPNEETQLPKEGGSGATAWQTNHYNRNDQNRKGTINEVEPAPLPPERGVHADLADDEPRDEAELKAAPHLVQAWDRWRETLKREIGTARHKNFSELDPGRTDYEACFAEWWFLGIHRSGLVWEFITHATDEAMTERGIAKYRTRLAVTIRAFFPIAASAEITFIVRKPDPARQESAAA